MLMADQAQRWAKKTFGDTELGDERRTARLVAMAAQLARTPAGTVGQVFTEDAERQGAYDFLESSRVGVGAILSAMTGAGALACAAEQRVLVAVDGSSLTLVDHNDSKDFGAIGDYAHGGRGTATMSVCYAAVTLKLKHPATGARVSLDVTAVLAREISTVLKGEERIDWLLLTNVAVNSIDDALAVIAGYTKRWRIEEFHKTWKSGACNVEESPLRSVEAVQRWATVSAAVAVRIERLKYLSRTEPTLPATAELTALEIRVLTALKKRRRRKNESIPAAPTIGDATRWIAELGGYTGKSSGGPPGATVLRRGLDRLHTAVEAAVALLGLDDDT